MLPPAAVAHGPGLIGTMLNVMLYGIMVAQTVMFFNTYDKDRFFIKTLVVVLFVADTINCVFDIAWIYNILINHFNDLDALATADWVFATDPAMVGIIATIVQLFFAWRVKVLTKHNWVVLLIFLTSLCSMLGGIGTAIAISIVPEFIHFQKFEVIVIIWLIGAAICDSSITIALTLYLRKHKTGFQGTDTLLNKLIRLTVQNGAICTVWAIIDLIVYLASPTGLHLAFNFPLAKLYTNSLMSTLNSRASWNTRMDSASTRSGQNKNIQLLDVSSASRREQPGNIVSLPRQEVYVNVESHQVIDNPDRKANNNWSEHTGSDTDKKDIIPLSDAV
ncbi:hypothetical protein C8Q75DRAFT_806090 [Abortiporus biennis]|nr:hypothetical protein C8Q75DRAFT_806090 [Abortiporus biennis]